MPKVKYVWLKGATTMKTASSVLLDHLKTLEPGETFTASSLNNQYPDMGNGAISGFINRMKSVGAVRVVKVTSGPGRVAETLEVTPGFDLASVHVKENYNGRKQGHANHRGITDRKRLSELLLSIAGEIESMKGSLVDYSTEELLKEVSRRVKVQPSSSAPSFSGGPMTHQHARGIIPSTHAPTHSGGNQMQLRRITEGEVHLSEAQSRLTQKDYELAQALFAVERKGDATKASQVAPPPIYQILAANLRNVTNREIIRDLLEEPVE